MSRYQCYFTFSRPPLSPPPTPAPRAHALAGAVANAATKYLYGHRLRAADMRDPVPPPAGRPWECDCGGMETEVRKGGGRGKAGF